MLKDVDVLKIEKYMKKKEKVSCLCQTAPTARDGALKVTQVRLLLAEVQYKNSQTRVMVVFGTVKAREAAGFLSQQSCAHPRNPLLWQVL